jgi:hypothetical protein
MQHLMDMVTKIKISQIELMTKNQLLKYIESITQTEICKDSNYCNQLVKIFLKK